MFLREGPRRIGTHLNTCPASAFRRPAPRRSFLSQRLHGTPPKNRPPGLSRTAARRLLPGPCGTPNPNGQVWFGVDIKKPRTRSLTPPTLPTWPKACKRNPARKARKKPLPQGPEIRPSLSHFATVERKRGRPRPEKRRTLGEGLPKREWSGFAVRGVMTRRGDVAPRARPFESLSSAPPTPARSSSAYDRTSWTSRNVGK
jgi:hypothetical protein